jgi:hypothetical protein
VIKFAGKPGKSRFAAARFSLHRGMDTMFESRHQEPIPPRDFIKRITLSIVLSAVMAAVALAVGVVGYHYLGEMGWVDALHNAAMILGGMGLVTEVKTNVAKIFSSAYALFCGLIFIMVVAVTLAPVLHRILHKFHVDETDLKK